MSCCITKVIPSGKHDWAVTDVAQMISNKLVVIKIFFIIGVFG
jgi:hypothetical protein